MKSTTKQLAASVGANIRRERKRREFSQEQLAEEVQISPQYLNLLENGRRCGSITTYLCISHEFGMSLSELFVAEKNDTRRLDDTDILSVFEDTSCYERRAMITILVALKSVLRL